MKEPYIYESPDGGKTVTRRKFGETKKETIQTADVLHHMFDSEPAVSTLTEKEIEKKFKTLRETLKSAHLRANWTQDYTMAKHVRETESLITQLERDVRVASETAKLAIKSISKENS